MNISLMAWLREHSPVVKDRRILGAISPEKLRHAFKYPGMISARPTVADPEEPMRKIRMTPEERAELAAEVRRNFEELRLNPEALKEVLDEGRFLDAAFNDPIVEE